MSRHPGYPFEPRSSTHLSAGDYWGIPLSDGTFACGRVLGVPAGGDPHIATGRMVFFGGLLDWCDDSLPESDAIAGRPLLDNGSMHVKAVQLHGGAVLGNRPLELDGIVGLRSVSHRAGGTVYVYEGFRRLREATREEAASMPLRSVWGMSVIKRLAERAFIEGLPIVR